MNSFHIYAFTLISGYIFYYIKYEESGYQKYIPFIINKIKRLIIPYIFIATVWVVPINKILLPNESIIEKFVLGVSPRQLCFLLMLFWVFAIFWLISDLAAQNSILAGVMISILYCAGIFAPAVYCLNRGLQYLLFFYTGFLIRKCNLGNKVLYRIPSVIYFIVNMRRKMRYTEHRNGIHVLFSL